MKAPTLLVMAGGTGGHIFPGIAVADELKNCGWNIHWLGTADKMESHIVPEHGYDISFINIGGVRHKGLITRLITPFKLIAAIWQARKVLKAIKPDVVLGMGGYASAPGGIAAWLSQIPLIVHEQNAAAGLTNRLLAKFASKICCAFPNAFEQDIGAQVVGNPLRASIAVINEQENPKTTATQQPTSSSRNILVVGGSLGAQVLNQVVPCAFKNLKNTYSDAAIWHQTGKNNKALVLSAYGELANNNHDVKIDEFIDNMAAAYAWADVVICRAGALTVSELAMASTPAIFVPLPHAVDDHQTKNAQFLVNNGAAQLMPQHEFNEQSLTGLMSTLLDKPETLALMAKAAFEASDGQATNKVANLCQQLSAKNKTVNQELSSNNKEIK